jgi:hypothetical protein
MQIDLQQLANIGQVIGSLAIVLLLYQLRATKRAEIGRNSIELLKYLQQEQIQSARRQVITRLRGKPLDQLNDEDSAAAGTVCASYDQAGVLIKRGIVDKTMFLHTWGASIVVTRFILSSFIEQRRQEMGATYYEHFDWLRDQAQKYHKRVGSEIALAKDTTKEAKTARTSTLNDPRIALQQSAA